MAIVAEPFRHGQNGDLRGHLPGKIENTSGNTRKCHGLNIGQPIGQGKTTAITRRQLVSLEITYTLIADDGPDSMQNKSRWQVVGTGNFSIAGLFPVLLDLHDRWQSWRSRGPAAV